jgi:hypothetical protein
LGDFFHFLVGSFGIYGVAECKYMGIFLNLAEIGLERVKGYQIVDWAIGYFLIWIYVQWSESFLA